MALHSPEDAEGKVGALAEFLPRRRSLAFFSILCKKPVATFRICIQIQIHKSMPNGKKFPEKAITMY